MYSDLFHSRAHAGSLSEATHYGEAGTPGQGPYIRLWLRVEDGVVREGRYKTYGCPAAIGCVEAVAGWREGRELSELPGVTTKLVTEWVEGLPEDKEHCSDLSAQALQAVKIGPGPQ